MSARVYLDLDRFKYVNDTAGHEVGDKLLVDLSQEVNKHLRRHDVAARIGGDEFALILKNVDESLAVSIADEIRTSLSNLRVHHDDKAYHVNASFGVAMMDIPSITAGDVMANADKGSVWLTIQGHQNIVAVGVLKELAAIILVNGRVPDEDTKTKAEEEGIPILLSALPAYQLAGRLYAAGIGKIVG